MKTIKDKDFVRLIAKQNIEERIQDLGKNISAQFYDKEPIILGVLNGSFMFLSDLTKTLQFPCQISFIKISSYEKMQSSNHINEVLGLQEDIKNRHIIIVEDIIDTGNTMHWLVDRLQEEQPASISTCTLLFKPKALIKEVEVTYYGFEIENDFVIGYGLDYDGFGRNLPEIYVVKN